MGAQAGVLNGNIDTDTYTNTLRCKIFTLLTLLNDMTRLVEVGFAQVAGFHVVAEMLPAVGGLFEVV